MPKPNPRTLRLSALPGALHAALILLAAVCVSVGTLYHGFVFDDHLLVGGNAPVILGVEPLSTAFTHRYWGAADEASPNELYRPITIVSLALNARLLGQNAGPMHAGNVLLHAANALLAYLLVRLLFARPTLALLTGLVFAVHPIATEAVAAVAGRADLLATLFLLSASILGLLASRHRRGWIFAGGLGVALCTFMGALSKESVFAAPLVMIAVLGSDALRHRGTRKDYREYLLTATTLAGIQVFVLTMVLILRWGILGYVYHTGPPENPSVSYLAFVNNPVLFAEPLSRVLTALRVSVMGAGLLVLPLNLSADYSFNQIPVTAGWPAAADLGAILFAGLYLAIVFFTARRFPVVMFALSWSALTYLLVSNLLFPIGTIFGERLLYMPSIGYALLLAAGLTRLAQVTMARRAMAAVLLLLVLGLYATRFMARAAEWADDDHLFKAAIAASPNSAKAHHNYGFTLQRAGRCEEAVPEYKRALEIAPGLTGSGVSLARCLGLLGRPQEAVEQYRSVIARDEGISPAWSGLGLALEATGAHDEAETAFRKALGLSLGRNREAIRGLAQVMLATHREDAAVEMLERVTKASPGATELREDLPQAHYLLGVRRLAEDRHEDFLAEMKRTIELDPDHGPAHYNLALDALNRGDKALASQHAREGLRVGYEFPTGFLEACGLDGPTAPPPSN